jgi:hypothetical protein
LAQAVLFKRLVQALGSSLEVVVVVIIVIVVIESGEC